MKTIFVVEQCAMYDGSDLLCAFDTEESARAHVAELEKSSHWGEYCVTELALNRGEPLRAAVAA